MNITASFLIKHFGSAHALNNLGLDCYLSQDYAEAAKCWKKSAEQGHPNAQYWLENCYHNGQGVEKDLAEAVKWYKKAAEQGCKEAQEALKKLQQ